MNKAQLLSSWNALPWPEIKLKTTQHLPKFVFILLIVLIVQTLAELTWRFLTPASVTSIALSTSHVSVNQTNKKQRLNDVAAYHLFGDAKKPVIIEQKIIDAPETRLRLTLKGVFASKDVSNVLAIISSSKGKDKTYHIGDKVSGGAILHAVYADRVILRRNGKLETLKLPKLKLDSEAIYSTNKSISSNKIIARTAQTSVQAKDPSQTQRLRKMRDTLLKEPSKIWEQVRINPVMQNGKIQGYTLVHNDKALMKSLKLRKTDVITAVNGQSLQDPATLYGLMNDLSDSSSLELSIERNGQPQTIQLNL